MYPLKNLSLPIVNYNLIFLFVFAWTLCTAHSTNLNLTSDKHNHTGVGVIYSPVGESSRIKCAITHHDIDAAHSLHVGDGDGAEVVKAIKLGYDHRKPNDNDIDMSIDITKLSSDVSMIRTNKNYKHEKLINPNVNVTPSVGVGVGNTTTTTGNVTSTFAVENKKKIQSDGKHPGAIAGTTERNKTNGVANVGGVSGGGVGGGNTEFGIKPIDGSVAAAAASSAKKLHFPAVPAGERIHIDENALLAAPLLPLDAFSTILGILQPIAFPLQMLREAVQGRLAFHELLLQVTKMEALVVIWSVCWLIAAAYVPYVTLQQICCRRRKFLQRLENHSSASSLEHADNLRRLQDNRQQHRRRVDRVGLQDGCHTIILNVILLLLIISLGLLLAGNEQTNRSIVGATASGSTSSLGAVVPEDVVRFTRNSEMQIAFVTAASLEIALDAVDKDLQDVENLLGKPIKETFGEYYNLENTFLSLKLIQQDSIEISKTVGAIKQACETAAEAGESLQRRLDDLVPLVHNIRQVCADRDGPLCETITETGLVVTFSMKELKNDGKLIYLGGISGQTNFNSSLHEAEMNYQDIARKIALETTDQRTAIRTSLERHRVDIHKQLRTLEDASRSLITSIKRAGDALAPYRAAIASWEMWRYLLTFVLAIILFITWLFLLCGTPCCCTQTKTTFAVIGGSLSAISAILLWILATSMLLLGTHGELFLCRPLYDPQYHTLSNLFDDNGVFAPSGGLLKIKLNLNESVRVSDVLRAMENNKTVYKAFNLKSLLDIDALTDHTQWPDVAAALQRIRVQRELKILSPALENALLDFTNAGGVNLTQHRVRASRPTVGKDLNAFLDQIYAIAKHLRDGRTKGRLENLTYKLRDIVDNEYKRLNDVQDSLIYHITALEVLLKPLVKRAEGVLVNLTKFQQSMNFELETISKNHVVNYTNRLEDYLAQFRANVLYEIKHRTAKTGPLWHIFAAIRVTLCDGCVDGINALSFACYLSILALAFLQPVLWRVIRRFRELNNEDSRTSRLRTSSVMLHRSASEELIHQNPQNWQTPRTHRAGSPDTIVRDLEESVWVSPRQTYEPYLPPPPPRQPSDSTIAAEQYATAGYQHQPENPIGFDRTNWTVVERNREVSPAPSSTRRWI